jgi:hypothetical protein
MEVRKTTRSPAQGQGGSPPRLRFHILHHAKMLMMLNILPIMCTIYLWWQYRAGNVTFKTISEESRTTALVVVVAGISFAIVCWFIMPIANWLRDYPTWHLRRSNSLIWIIPTVGGWMLWIIIGIVGIMAGGAAIIITVMGIWRLFSLAS